MPLYQAIFHRDCLDEKGKPTGSRSTEYVYFGDEQKANDFLNNIHNRIVRSCSYENDYMFVKGVVKIEE